MPEFRITTTLPAPGGSVAETIKLVRWAEENGFDDVWFADGGAPDALTMCAAVAGITQRLRIGIAVTPVYSRSPAVLAASAYTLAQLMPGRFVMGLGSSSQTMIEQWHGVPMKMPLTRVKETAQLVRSMLTGAKSDFQGKTLRSSGYRQQPLENPPPIFLAALRSNMIEMAAEVGDGVIFNLWPRSALPKMLGHVKVGAEKAGKNWKDVEVANRHMVLVTDDVPAARNAFRAWFAPYYATPVYNNFLAWAGFEEAAAMIREGWAKKDRNLTSAALTDALVDEIAIIGSADECRARIRELASGGIHTHIIAPLSLGQKAEQYATFDAFKKGSFKF